MGNQLFESSELKSRLNGLLQALGQPAIEYGVNMARWPVALREAFVQSGPDEALVDYLETVVTTRASAVRTITQRLLRTVMSDYDANALLRMYPMHLCSTAQAERLLGGRRRNLLDIGAGSGDVTAALQPLFETVEVLEASRGARWRLRGRGYRCHDYDVVRSGIGRDDYDVISLLNVLDRADQPLSLLGRCRERMDAAASLLISVPLPYRPLVYSGAFSREPRERMPIVGNQFSDAVLRLVQLVLSPAGFEVERFTRLPYLSGGDTTRAITVLDAAVLCCRKSE